MPATECQTLLQTVIRGDYCIGCGACAAMEHSPFHIALDEIGRYQASADAESAAECPVLAVCPFSGEGPDEDAIAKPLYGGDCGYDKNIGYHLATYAGYVAEGTFRRNGSSGGMATWICVELLQRGLIDAVVQVRPTAPAVKGHPMFVMCVSRSEEEIRACSKSRYYPVEMSQVLREAASTPGRYAVVGVPCFIKAVRRLTLQDPRLKERIAFCISLICGQLKTTAFAEMMAWQVGVHPDSLTSIGFRRKIKGVPGYYYFTEATGASEEGPVIEIGADCYGLYNWGGGLLKYNACNYCDDVVGETADVSLGDAWLPRYLGDSGGTSIIIVRNRRLFDIIEKAKSEGRLHLDPITPKVVVQSQAAGFRQRRQEIAYRLFLKDAAGVWRPRKRVAASASSVSRKRRRIQDLRLQLTPLSHVAFQRARDAGRFEVFEEVLAPLFRQYAKLYHVPLWRRIVGRLFREFRGRILHR
jgi:coenzyme F420-reducing hydrogenase beta subunit